MTSQDVIEKLGLEPLEHEGGFFSRVFSSETEVSFAGTNRPAATIIYFLVTPEDFSAMHILRLPEFYSHIAGDALGLTILDPADRSAKTVRLGPISDPQSQPYYLVPENVWQGSRLFHDGAYGWALVSCTLGPGFHWSDFELGDRAILIEQFPESAGRIKELTRVN